MPILLFLIFLEPIDSVFLNRELNSIEIYNHLIYCAPFTGKSIFMLDESRNLKPITFTDDPSYRIYGFAFTPFALYINNGRSIEKFYLASGVKEGIYISSDISSFIITLSEEIIFSNRQENMLIFLDFTNRVKLTIDDLNIKDLYLADDVIYILTKNSVLLCDKHGNIFEKKKIPEKLSKIFVDTAHVVLFSSDKKYFYLLNTDWEKIELSHGIRDIAGNDKFIVMLNENGTNLYIYDSSRFK